MILSFQLGIKKQFKWMKKYFVVSKSTWMFRWDI